MIRNLSIVLLTVAVAGGCAKSSSDAPPQEAPATAEKAPPISNGLARVEDPSQVCMVTNMYMGKAQIPIEVEGKTYFGCCEMCKGRLANEPAVRTAVDPVTGQQVDKSTAVLAQDAGGNILYFASQQSMDAYR